MRGRLSVFVAMVAAVVVAMVAAGCTSSGGGGPNKTGHEWFQARPLVMPGQPASTARPNPFGSLPVPTSEAAYDALSRAQRSDLAAALRGVDCAHPPRLTHGPDRVVCDADSNAFLLGAPLFTGNDVEQARATGPSNGVAGWQVFLSLTPAAADTMHRWTSRHHVLSSTGEFNDVQTSSKPPCGFTMFTRCSDFTAYVSRNVVVTIPVNFAAVRGKVEINGQFSQALATRLADHITR